MLKEYQVILDKPRSKVFSRLLREKQIEFCASEVGGFICYQLQYQDNKVIDISIMLDKVNAEVWVDEIHAREEENQLQK